MASVPEPKVLSVMAAVAVVVCLLITVLPLRIAFRAQPGPLHLSAPNALARHVLIQTTDRDVVATAVPQILRQEGQHYAGEIIGR